MRSRRCLRRGFTLIEILVVVAIIALLVAILLPSLARARQQARMIVCQSNVKQLLLAFNLYTVSNAGRLPGSRKDDQADWLGGSNTPPGGSRSYGVSGGQGKQPEWGTIYRYMNKQNGAYMCPDDPTIAARSKLFAGYSYSANVLLSGAKSESLSGAHYPLPLGPIPFSSQLGRTDHTTGMAKLDGTPLLIEEHERYYLDNSTNDDSGWANQDTITARHLSSRAKRGYGNLGYVDGHVARIEAYVLSDPTSPGGSPPEIDYLQAKYFCVRTGRKWVSMKSCEYPDSSDGSATGRRFPGMYKYLDHAREARLDGITHN